MSDRRRTGERKPRPKAGTRKPDLGYYIIVTDAKETELNYFKGLHRSLPEHLQSRLVVKVIS